MAQRRNRTERQSDKDAEIVEAVVRAESAQTPMERFKAVARRVVNVSRPEFEEARHHDDAERKKRRTKRRAT
jgi:hypothetical protein